jgi:hypothetical protein
MDTTSGAVTQRTTSGAVTQRPKHHEPGVSQGVLLAIIFRPEATARSATTRQHGIDDENDQRVRTANSIQHVDTTCGDLPPDDGLLLN